MPSKHRAVFVAIALPCALGCASNPATGVMPTGEPLRVQYNSGTGTYVAHDKVGTAVHKDDHGNQLGTTDIYRPVAHSFAWSNWKYLQGGHELDEQDFYRLAGDQAAADEVLRKRSAATTKMTIGVSVLLASVAAAVAVNQMKSHDDMTTAGASSSGGSKYALAACGAGILGGGLVWYWGSGEMARKHHLAAERANYDADLVETCESGRCRSEPGGRARAGTPPEAHAAVAP